MTLKGAVALRASAVLLSLSNRVRLGDEGGGEGGFPFVRARKRRNYQVLAYHRVGEASPYAVDRVPADLFGRQMELLSRRFNVLTLTELVERSKTGDLPPNAVAVTFDDGYRDNYEYAYPVLKRYGMPATIFLATGCIGTSGMPWHERVFSFMRTFPGGRLRSEGEEHDLSGPSAKRDFLERQIARLKTLDPDSRDRWIDGIVSGNPNPQFAAIGRTMLSWDEVREMAQGGIEFGAHTVNHPILSRIPPDEAAREIHESKRQIEERLEGKVHAFAYPNGKPQDYGDLVKKCARDAGFSCAVTTIWGSNDGDTDPFELRRVGLWGSCPETSILRLAYYRMY